MAIGSASAFPPPRWSLAASVKRSRWCSRRRSSSHRYRPRGLRACRHPMRLLRAGLLRLMGASPQIVAGRPPATHASLSAAAAPILLALSQQRIFRGAGDAAIAMRLLGVSNIINLVLRPLPHFRLGTVPQARRHRSCARHFHRPQHWRALSVLSTFSAASERSASS